MNRFQVLSLAQAKSVGLKLPAYAKGRWVIWDKQDDEWVAAYRLKKDAEKQCKEWNLDEMTYKGFQITEHRVRGYDISLGGEKIGWERTRLEAQDWIDDRLAQEKRTKLRLVHSAPLSVHELLLARVKRARELEAKRKQERTKQRA